MADPTPLSASDANRLAVRILARGAFAPACLHPDGAVAAYERAMDGLHLRAAEQDDPALPAEELSQRSQAAVLRAKQSIWNTALFEELLRLELYELLRLNTTPGNVSHGLPVQVIEERLRAMGWDFGTHRRSAALRAGEAAGWAAGTSRRWFSCTGAPPDFTPAAWRALHLSRWLGSITRTTCQRFQRIEGSILSAMGFLQRPRRSRQFVLDLWRWMDRWLAPHHVPWWAIPRGSEGELAMLTVSLLSGRSEPGVVSRSPWQRDLLQPVLGGDLARRTGGVDLAGWTLHRCLADGALERVLEEAARRGIELTQVAPVELPLIERAKQAAKAADFSALEFVEGRCGLDWCTLNTWLSGPQLDPDSGDPRANGGPVGAAMVRLVDMLVRAHPKGIPVSELLRRMREQGSSDISGRIVVEAALSRLEADDLIGSEIEHDVRKYTSRRGQLALRVVDWRRMQAVLEQYVRPLPGLVDQVWADHPAAGVGSLCYVIPRRLLPEFEAAYLEELDRLRAVYDRANRGLPDEVLLARGRVHCTVLIQGCVTPIHLKRPERQYR